MRCVVSGDDIDETPVTEGNACLSYRADYAGEWWTIHAKLLAYHAPIFNSAADLRRFLVRALVELDEWEARRER